jgi:RNA polymerase sigma factor (sigma-70 family)
MEPFLALRFFVPRRNPAEGPVSAKADPGVFATTHWGAVVAAGQSDEKQAAAALEELCRTYWYPLYTFVRRQGKSPEDAEDLTQNFFARLLEKGYLAKADPSRGRFRTFLLGSLNNFLINDWKREGRIKRGRNVTFVSFDGKEAEEIYGEERFGETDPTNLFDRQWAETLIARVLSILRDEYAAVDKAELFTALKTCVWGETKSVSYSEIGKRLNLAEGAVKVAAHRLRKRFRTLLRTEIGHTVARPEDIDEELRLLIEVLS